MKHGKKVNHLGRKVAHRKSMLANMASSLIEHKRINTTVAKAKALKQFVEPLITKSKNDTTHNRRLVFSALRNKYAVAELFRAVAQKVGDRPGGYTRVIKLGNRLGDNASMAMIELVDFNEVYTLEKADAKKSTRRSRSRKKATAETAAPAATQAAEKSEEAPAPKAAAEEAVADQATAEAPQAETAENTDDTPPEASDNENTKDV
ncbi:MAG: 50S ribosomal protein L17 [Flavobacteriia bacterium]|jgi:large subunit ribosomal protein L17|nr:50S ribosomal protein L17 [Flavobacteriia bacterium]